MPTAVVSGRPSARSASAHAPVGISSAQVARGTSCARNVSQSHGSRPPLNILRARVLALLPRIDRAVICDGKFAGYIVRKL